MNKAVNWKFLVKHLGPDVREAWERDVGLPADDFTIGYSGAKNPRPRSQEKPLRGFATNRRNVTAHDLKWFTYDPQDKRWTEYKPGV